MELDERSEFQSTAAAAAGVDESKMEKTGVKMPDPITVARAALCAKASYAQDCTKTFEAFRHLNFNKVWQTPVFEKPSSILTPFSKKTPEKIKAQRFLVALADEDSIEVEVYVAFRGTTVMADVFVDGDYSQTELTGYGVAYEGAVPGHFHRGFTTRVVNSLPPVHDIYDFCKNKANGKKIRRLVFCGHSLGGAISHIAMLKLFMTTYGPEQVSEGKYLSIGFGAPHIVDALAAKYFTYDFPVSNVLFTFIHEEDPVPLLLHDFPTLIGAVQKSAADLVTGLLSDAKSMENVTTEVDNYDDDDNDGDLSESKNEDSSHAATGVANVVGLGADLVTKIMQVRSSLGIGAMKYATIGSYFLVNPEAASLKGGVHSHVSILTPEAFKRIADNLTIDNPHLAAHHMGGYLHHLCPKSHTGDHGGRNSSTLKVLRNDELEPYIEKAELVIHNADYGKVVIVGRNLRLVMKDGWKLRPEKERQEPSCFNICSYRHSYFKFDDRTITAKKLHQDYVNENDDLSKEKIVLKIAISLPEEVQDETIRKLARRRLSSTVHRAGLELSVTTSFGSSNTVDVILDRESRLLEPFSPLFKTFRQASEKLLIMADSFGITSKIVTEMWESILVGLNYVLEEEEVKVFKDILKSNEILSVKYVHLCHKFLLPLDVRMCGAAIHLHSRSILGCGMRENQCIRGYYHVLHFLSHICTKPLHIPRTKSGFICMAGAGDSGIRDSFESLEDRICSYLPMNLVNELKNGSEDQGLGTLMGSFMPTETSDRLKENTANDILKWLKMVFGFAMVKRAAKTLQMVAIVGPETIPLDILHKIFGVPDSVTFQYEKNVYYMNNGKTKLLLVHFPYTEISAATGGYGYSQMKRGFVFEKNFDLCVLLVNSNGQEESIRDKFTANWVMKQINHFAHVLVRRGCDDRVKICHMETLDDPASVDALKECGILQHKEAFHQIQSLLMLSPSRTQMTVLNDQYTAGKPLVDTVDDDQSSKRGLVTGIVASSL